MCKKDAKCRRKHHFGLDKKQQCFYNIIVSKLANFVFAQISPENRLPGAGDPDGNQRESLERFETNYMKCGGKTL